MLKVSPCSNHPPVAVNKAQLRLPILKNSSMVHSMSEKVCKYPINAVSNLLRLCWRKNEDRSRHARTLNDKSAMREHVRMESHKKPNRFSFFPTPNMKSPRFSYSIS